MQAGKHSHLKFILPIIILAVIVLALLVTAVGTASLLGETQNTLASTQSELSSALTDAGATHTKLTLTESTLSLTQTDLTTTKNKLTDTQKEKQIVSNNLTTALIKLNETETKLAATSIQLETTKQLSDSYKSTADNQQINLNRMTTGYGYMLKDPTYQEVKAFIAADRTNSKPYVYDTYVCEDFSNDVKVHAMQQKIRCAYISIRFFGDNSGHAIVAFNTTDRGMVYIEPQSDEEVNLVAGKHYWTQCVIASPDHYYLNPTTYNDTIDRFNIIW